MYKIHFTVHTILFIVLFPVLLPLPVFAVSATISERHSEEGTVMGLERAVTRSCDVLQCVLFGFLAMCCVSVSLAGFVLVP